MLELVRGVYMIYTCTTNPSLDYYITLKDLKMGINNRSDMEMFEAGGKGVNVSIVLNNFHIQSTCLGFLGGFTKDFYLSFISAYPNIQPLFTTIKENTRINVKIMDSNYETGLNAIGPHISDEEYNKFKSRLFNIYSDDIFVLSGSVEDEIEDRIVENVKELGRDGVRIVLDTEPQLIDQLIESKPFMIKLNDTYLEYKNDSLENLAKDMVNRGVKFVLYSSVNKRSYLFTQDEILMCNSLEGGLVNSTGSADSMVAGFIYGVIRGANSIESFKYANAASLATSMSNDLGSKEKIEQLFDKIEVNKL